MKKATNLSLSPQRRLCKTVWQPEMNFGGVCGWTAKKICKFRITLWSLFLKAFTMEFAAVVLSCLNKQRVTLLPVRQVRESIGVQLYACVCLPVCLCTNMNVIFFWSVFLWVPIFGRIIWNFTKKQSCPRVGVTFHVLYWVLYGLQTIFWVYYLFLEKCAYQPNEYWYLSSITKTGL